ncbi:Ribonuclease P protein subunit p30 [Morella rubra]|uniref:Ribonuclease P protein subunit p30 n=1 Tax=Morella rubra TaxID=262757 RepID=A0A6A1WP58_9ROSI|nr:Ribonuclease P protein subunit p30 [Morella rubra]
MGKHNSHRKNAPTLESDDENSSVSSSSTTRSDLMSVSGTEEVELDKDSLLDQALDALYEKRNDTEETERSMQILWQVAHPKLGSNVVASKPSAAVISAVVSAWSFLLKTMDGLSLNPKHWQDLLDKDDRSVRIAAGEALALIFEIGSVEKFCAKVKGSGDGSAQEGSKPREGFSHIQGLKRKVINQVRNLFVEALEIPERPGREASCARGAGNFSYKTMEISFEIKIEKPKKIEYRLLQESLQPREFRKRRSIQVLKRRSDVLLMYTDMLLLLETLKKKSNWVDIIAIDFSEKLPFRLKLPMVKAAIERGVYFEITYSDLISDVRTRRQMISNAKLLVDWTRGKNLILSSAAPSVNDIRGPNDVANLSSLLGLSMERAKAAISKNCRILVAKSLRKKQFYKEAIRVEVISAGGQLDSTKSLSGDWLKWDPISSCEGDLLLEDMAKSFSASSEASKTVKAIDFTSVIDSMPSLGFQVKALISQTEAVPQPPDDGKTLLAATEVVEVPTAAGGQPEQLDRLDIVLRPD